MLELGVGDGINFPLYPPQVSEVVATEPESYLRAEATQAAERASVPVRLLDATADHLTVPDDSLDAAVCSLVLCSVPDQARALAELHGVLRSDGELRFYEHVLSQDPWGFSTEHQQAMPAGPRFAVRVHGCTCSGRPARPEPARGAILRYDARPPSQPAVMQHTCRRADRAPQPPRPHESAALAVRRRQRARSDHVAQAPRQLGTKS